MKGKVSKNVWMSYKTPYSPTQISFPNYSLHTALLLIGQISLTSLTEYKREDFILKKELLVLQLSCPPLSFCSCCKYCKMCIACDKSDVYCDAFSIFSVFLCRYLIYPSSYITYCVSTSICGLQTCLTVPKW